MASIDFQSIGTWDRNNTSAAMAPGDPSGVVSGNLLICAIVARQASITVDAGMTGWTLLHSRTTNGSAYVYGRIADGTASDSPAPDLSGSTNVASVVLRYDGNVPGDIADLVPTSGESDGGGTASAGNLPVHSTTAPTVTDALVFVLARKNKTNATNGDTISETTEFTIRGTDVPDGSRNMVAVGDWQQTGAGANYDGDDFSHTTSDDALTQNSIIIYFQPATSTELSIRGINRGVLMGVMRGFG